MKVDLSVDLTQADSFLNILDPTTDVFTFQIIPERKDCSRRAYILSGSLNEVATTLHQENEAGCGIYVTINKGTPGKRRATDITSVRAFFVELDRGDITVDVMKQIEEIVQASLIVESSPGRCHVYWLMHPDCGESLLDKFSAIQRVLQYKFKGFLAGKESKDLPRVLRLPGFYHQKKKPHLVSIKAGGYYLYNSFDELASVLDIDEDYIQEASSYFGTEGLLETSFTKSKSNPALDGCTYIGCAAGDRNGSLFNYGFEVLIRQRGVDYDTLLGGLLAANVKNTPPLSNEEVINISKSIWDRKSRLGVVSVTEQKEQIADVVTDTVESNEEVEEQVELFPYDYSKPDMYPAHSQLSVAARISQRFGEHIKYNSHKGFYVRDTNTGFWRVTDGRIGSLLSEYYLAVTSEIELEPQFRENFIDDKLIFKPSQLRNALKDMHTHTSIKNVLACLQTRENIHCEHTDFETEKDANLIAVKQGILNLLTNTGVDDETFLNSRLINGCNVTYDPTAKCPVWESFIASCMADDIDSINYVKRICGYLISGETFLNSFFIIYGVPGTGKSRFLNVMSALLGSYSIELSPSVLLAESTDASSLSSLAQAQYCRMATVMEVGMKDKWNTSILKALAGDDYITAKMFFCNPYQYRPRFKLCIRANNMPSVDSFDQAIWERVKLLPFNVKFRGTDREDNQLEDKLLAELPGILNWCSEGYRMLMTDRQLVIPTYISDNVGEVRSVIDPIQSFIDNGLVIDPSSNELWYEVYDSFVAWARENDIKVIAKHQALKSMVDKGIGTTGKLKGLRLMGISLKREFRLSENGTTIQSMI